MDSFIYEKYTYMSGTYIMCVCMWVSSNLPNNVDDIVPQMRRERPIICQSDFASSSPCPDGALVCADLFWSNATDGDEPV